MCIDECGGELSAAIIWQSSQRQGTKSVFRLAAVPMRIKGLQRSNGNYYSQAFHRASNAEILARGVHNRARRDSMQGSYQLIVITPDSRQ